MKNKILIICCLMYFVFNSVYSQNEIILNGEKIPLNKIPINGEAYKYFNQLKSNKNNDNIDEEQTKRIYSSANKNFFLIIKEKILTSNIDEYTEMESLLDFFDKKGNKLWNKSYKNHTFMKVFISNDGNYITIHYRHNFDTEESADIISFNKNGKTIFEDKDIFKLHNNYSNDIFIYLKDYFLINKESQKKLYILSLKKSRYKPEEISYNSMIYNITLSGEGENFLCITDKLYSYNIKGQLLWEKEIGKYSGFYALSFNGKYYLNYTNEGKVEICDNSNGKIILTKEAEIINNKEFVPVDAYFIKGDNLFVLRAYDDNHILMLAIYNIKGKLVQYKEMSEISCNAHILFFELNKDNDYDYYFDNVYVGSFKKE
ncbi:MAG: hypothetical protein KA792_04550 [Bacteroidales bacterium]|nr:hypothetical protein [Bacteroidales bacterium]